MMRHLRKLARQYYEWQGYLVQEDVIVGLRESGRYDGMLDFVAYHPKRNRVLHIEFAARHGSWDDIRGVIAGQFGLGRSFIFTDVFAHFTWRTDLQQLGVLGEIEEHEIDRIPVVTIAAFIDRIRRDVASHAASGDVGVPHRYDLLRDLQLECSRQSATRH